LEDVNNLLNAGEVPNMFPQDEKMQVGLGALGFRNRYLVVVVGLVMRSFEPLASYDWLLGTPNVTASSSCRERSPIPPPHTTHL